MSEQNVYVVVDVEMSGNHAQSMFAVAMCAQFGKSTEADRETFVEYFPVVDKSYNSTGTLKWWNGDAGENPTDAQVEDGKTRAVFYKEAMKKASENTREDAAKSIRAAIDKWYSLGNVVFLSDFSAFDHGAVNQLMSEFGLLPIQKKTATSYPAELVSHDIYVKGLAHLPPTADSSEARKKLKLDPVKSEADHNPLKDIVHIMDDAMGILNSI
ncbi:MAG: hypothetical protein ACTSUE_03655 [Promethearchaeota archaeon]